MQSIIKIWNAVGGFLLLLRYYKSFDTRLLAGKRIAIVGPASSAYNTGRGHLIDSFDIVLRINKAPLLLREGKFTKDIGSKTDILFHCFFENEFSGGGALDFDLYDQLNIKYVVNPIPTFFGRRATFNFYKKYLLSRKVYSLSPQPYRLIVKRFGRFRPTTGFCALMAAMDSDFSQLFITGFTFFRTPYGDGYRDALKEVAVNRKYIADSNIHNPEVEYESFKVLLKKNSHKDIRVDKELRSILAADGLQVNEIN